MLTRLSLGLLKSVSEDDAALAAVGLSYSISGKTHP